MPPGQLLHKSLEEINEPLTSDDSFTVPNVKSTSAATYTPNVPITTKLVVTEDAE